MRIAAHDPLVEGQKAAILIYGKHFIGVTSQQRRRVRLRLRRLRPLRKRIIIVHDDN
jgi:hypothetical protein